MKFSKAARKIYEDYTDQVEAFGMDECWLDVTGSAGIYGNGEKIAQEIRERIKFELGLFCDPLHTEKTEKIDRTVEDLRLHFGMDIIRNACLLDNPKMPSGGGPQVIMPTGVPT